MQSAASVINLFPRLYFKFS